MFSFLSISHRLIINCREHSTALYNYIIQALIRRTIVSSLSDSRSHWNVKWRRIMMCCKGFIQVSWINTGTPASESFGQQFDPREISVTLSAETSSVGRPLGRFLTFCFAVKCLDYHYSNVMSVLHKRVHLLYSGYATFCIRLFDQSVIAFHEK